MIYMQNQYKKEAINISFEIPVLKKKKNQTQSLGYII